MEQKKEQTRRDPQEKLSTYFRLYEIECRCGCGFSSVDARLLSALDELRELLGRPVRVTSACRCKEHNRRLGSDDSSQHVAGRAADIYVYDLTPYALYHKAVLVPSFAEGGIGIYPQNGFCHVDVRETGRARWVRKNGVDRPFFSDSTVPRK